MTSGPTWLPGYFTDLLHWAVVPRAGMSFRGTLITWGRCNAPVQVTDSCPSLPKCSICERELALVTAVYPQELPRVG